LQGFLPLDPPPGSPLARFLQPKCLRPDGAGWGPLTLAVPMCSGSDSPGGRSPDASRPRVCDDVGQRPLRNVEHNHFEDEGGTRDFPGETTTGDLTCSRQGSGVHTAVNDIRIPRLPKVQGTGPTAGLVRQPSAMEALPATSLRRLTVAA